MKLLVSLLLTITIAVQQQHFAMASCLIPALGHRLKQGSCPYYYQSETRQHRLQLSLFGAETFAACTISPMSGYTSKGSGHYYCQLIFNTTTGARQNLLTTSSDLEVTGCATNFYQFSGAHDCRSCRYGTIASAAFGAHSTACNCTQGFSDPDCSVPPPCFIPDLGPKQATGNCTIGTILAPNTSCTIATAPGYTHSGNGTYRCNSDVSGFTIFSDLVVTGCATNFYQSAAGTNINNAVCTACDAPHGSLASADFGVSKSVCTCSNGYTGDSCATPPCTIPSLGWNVARGTCSTTLLASHSCYLAGVPGYTYTGNNRFTCHANTGKFTVSSNFRVTGCMKNFYQSAGSNATNGVCSACDATNGVIPAAVFGSSTSGCTCSNGFSGANCSLFVPVGTGDAIPVSTLEGANTIISGFNNKNGSDVALTDSEIKQQQKQKNLILAFVLENVNSITNAAKIDVLEKVTQSSTTLDIDGAELAINVSSNILNDLLNNGASVNGFDLSAKKKLTDQVGGVVSNVVGALDVVGGKRNSESTSQDRTKQKEQDEAYTRAVKQVYGIVGQLSDVQLIGVGVQDEAIFLSTPSYQLVSKRTNTVGKEQTIINSNDTVFQIPIDLGPNMTVSGANVDIQMTSWSVNLHQNEVPTVDGPSFVVSINGLSYQQFTEDLLLRQKFVQSIQDGMIAGQHGTETLANTMVSIVQVSKTPSRRLLRDDIRARMLEFVPRCLVDDKTEQRGGLDIAFAVEATMMNDDQVENALNSHLKQGLLNKDLGGGTIESSTTGKKINLLTSITPSGSITTLKIKHNGKEVRVENAGWIYFTQKWTGQNLNERILRQQTEQQNTKNFTTNRRVNQSMACNATNVGRSWNVRCAGGGEGDRITTAAGTSSNIDTIYETNNYLNRSKLNQSYIDAHVQAKCPRWYVDTSLAVVVLSIVLFLVALAHYCFWYFLENATHMHIHHFNDWLMLYLVGCPLVILVMSNVYHSCQSTNSTVLTLHVALVLAAIITICLTVITMAVLFFLAPKNYQGCFPTTHKQELYERKRLERKRLDGEHFMVEAKNNATSSNALHTSISTHRTNLNKNVSTAEGITVASLKASHSRRSVTDYLYQEAGPIEAYWRWHWNWLFLLVVLCMVLLPSSLTTLIILATNGLSLTGTSSGSALQMQPSASVIDARIQHAKQFNNDELVCQTGDQYSLVLECPMESLSVTPSTMDVCAYWDEKHRYWSKKGCELVSYNVSTTICRCNHLTDFGTAAKKSAVVFERIFDAPDLVQLFIVHWYAMVAIGAVIATYLATATYGHRYDKLLQRRSSMRGAMVAVVIIGGMLRRHRTRKKAKNRAADKAASDQRNQGQKIIETSPTNINNERKRTVWWGFDQKQILDPKVTTWMRNQHLWKNVDSSFVQLFLKRLYQESFVLELFFVNDRYFTRIHRATVFISRVAVKVAVIGMFFILKKTTIDALFDIDRLVALILGYAANMLVGFPLQLLFILLATKRRERNFRTYRYKFRQDQLEESFRKDKYWLASLAMEKCCCCCSGRGDDKGCAQTKACIDWYEGFVWLIGLSCIGFCIYFGTMFAFVLDNPILAEAWINTVMMSMVIWLLITQPVKILFKTIYAKYHKTIEKSCCCCCCKCCCDVLAVVFLFCFGIRHSTAAPAPPQQNKQLELVQPNRYYAPHNSDIVGDEVKHVDLDEVVVI